MKKVFHYINFVLIFLFLVGICVLEDCCVNSALKHTQDNLYAIESAIEDKDSLLDSEIVMLVDNIEYQWMQDESTLCFLVNHKSIQEIGIEISKLKACVVVDNIEDFRLSLQQIDFHCKEYLHFMGANLHNLL